MRRRLTFRRSPVLFWLATAALAALSAVFMARLVGTAEARANALGGLRPVPVATWSLPAGHVVRAGDFTVAQLPRAVLPEGEIASDPVGGMLVVPIVAGEVILRAKLGPDGVKGVAALVDDGRRGIGIPVGSAMPPLVAGNHVDVLATFETAERDDAAPTFPVAVSAVVLHVGGDTVTVAVTAEEATRVAFALARGVVVLALTPSLS